MTERQEEGNGNFKDNERDESSESAEQKEQDAEPGPSRMKRRPGAHSATIARPAKI